MRLSLYFFRQYLPSFSFGLVLFSFIFIIDKTFDLIDLILNKGVDISTVAAIFLLFIPTTFPLALPMAALLGCMVTFGRLSEENEITAVRAAGISLSKVLWIFPLFAFLISLFLIPFNTHIAPGINRSFRTLYEKIIHADPLVNIIPKKFFAIKNIKIYANDLDPTNKSLRDLFVYKLSDKGQPSERIFARAGIVDSNNETFKLTLKAGQLQRYDMTTPTKLVHTTFGEYVINIPINVDTKRKSTRFRNISSPELRKMIQKNKKRGLKTSVMEAENSLRYALSFAPLCLILIGLPLANSLKKGGRGFNVGISIIVIFTYYLMLIFGLTMAEKAILPSHPALWIANFVCLGAGLILMKRLIKK